MKASRGTPLAPLYGCRCSPSGARWSPGCGAALGAKRREDFLLHWREAMEIRDPMFALLASQWPGFASVRVEPGFVRILKEIGWDRPFDGAGA
jgi:hypothetical protein